MTARAADRLRPGTGHTGLAEIAAGLEGEYPPHLRHLASFTSGDAEDLRARLRELLDLDTESWRALSEGARRAAVRLWSWDHVAGRSRELAAGAEDDGRQLAAASGTHGRRVSFDRIAYRSRDGIERVLHRLEAWHGIATR